MALTQKADVVTGRYEIDAANSRVGFAARYAMVSTIRGSFSRFRADIFLDPEAPERSTASVRLEAASIDTGQAQRDEHLRSPDFLDAATYPEIRFESTAVRPTGFQCHELAGDLTVRATTAPVTIEFTLTGLSTDHRGIDLVGFAGSTKISRSAFGMLWNPILETGGVLVGDEVELEFDLALMRTQSGPSPDPAGARTRRWYKPRRPGRRG